MKIAIAGASGFLGSHLIPFLRAGGHEVVPMVRPSSGSSDGIAWDPARGRVDVAALEGTDAVINLAGRGIGKRPFTSNECRKLRASRIDSTAALARALTEMERPPAVLVNASAVGYYGDRDAQILDERSGPGRGFLAELCVDWEAATSPAVDAGIRVALLRTGIVLGHGGPLFKRLIPAFKMGVGGRLGDGTQYQSWISLTDQLRAIGHVVTSDVSGPVNLVGPAPVTNAELTRAIGRAMRRPAVMVVPRVAVALALGRIGAGDLLASQRALPSVLEGDGFVFEHASLDSALSAIFG